MSFPIYQVSRFNPLNQVYVFNQQMIMRLIPSTGRKF